MADKQFCEKVEKQFCAKVSKHADEQFIATAPNVDLWFLIEYTGKWSASAIKDSTLPSAVKEWLDTQKAQYPTSRAQFIRQHLRKLESITFYVAVSREDRQALYKFELESYEDLLGIDIPGLVIGHELFDRYLSADPIYLVCTNGKHDQCCSKFGMPVYNELERVAGQHGWQTTHLGGDRFAANMVCLPYGIYYGRVAVPEVHVIMEHTAQHQVYERKYRGRTCYSVIAQAAEYFIRTSINNYDLTDFRLLSLQEEEESHFKVAFQSTHTCHIHQILLSQEKIETPRYSACCGNKPVVQRTYKVKSYSILDTTLAYVS